MNALAAALLHATWQGAAVAILAAAASSLLTSARARSGVALAGLAALTAAPAVSVVLLLREEGTVLGASLGPIAVPGAAALGVVVDSGTRALFDGPAVAPRVLVGVWAAGVALLLGRLCLGLLGTWRLRRTATPAPHPVGRAVRRAGRRLGMRRPIAALQSDRLQVPAALGGRRPAVLVPASLATQFESGGSGPHHAPELDAIIEHEVAHVRRGDWGVNLLQSVADALLWFHPAAWWLSARARREREFACDDLAAGTSEGRLRLARALAELESMRSGPGLALSSAAGPLLARVRRLLPGRDLGSRSVSRSPGRWAGFAVALALAAAAAWVTVIVMPGSARAAMGPASTLTAHDGAGSFTISFRGGRVVAATVDGEAVPMGRLRQTADSLYFLDPGGSVDFGVGVKPNAAGITWQSRPPR